MTNKREIPALKRLSGAGWFAVFVGLTVVGLPLAAEQGVEQSGLGYAAAAGVEATVRSNASVAGSIVLTIAFATALILSRLWSMATMQRQIGLAMLEELAAIRGAAENKGLQPPPTTT